LEAINNTNGSIPMPRLKIGAIKADHVAATADTDKLFTDKNINEKSFRVKPFTEKTLIDRTLTTNPV
jgi:hypothetical protein